MRKLKLYIETSLFGFYFDEIERNFTKRKAVRKLFNQIKFGFFEGYISPITYAELNKSEEPFRTRDLKLIDQYSLLPLSSNDEEIAYLYKTYVKENILEEEYHADLLHIAAATVSFIDVLVTYNCEHIANERTSRLVRSINLREGFRTEFSITTPEEVIIYGE